MFLCTTLKSLKTPVDSRKTEKYYIETKEQAIVNYYLFGGY